MSSDNASLTLILNTEPTEVCNKNDCDHNETIAKLSFCKTVSEIRRQKLTFYAKKGRILSKHHPGWKSTAVHRWSPMFHRSPTGGPPVVTDCSTDGTRIMQVQQKSGKLCENHWIQIYS